MYCLLTKQGGRYSCHSEITLRSMKYFIVDFKSLTVFLFHIYSYDSFRFTNIFYFGAINVHRSCGLHQQHCDSLTFFTASVFFSVLFFSNYKCPTDILCAYILRLLLKVNGPSRHTSGHNIAKRSRFCVELSTIFIIKMVHIVKVEGGRLSRSQILKCI